MSDTILKLEDITKIYPNGTVANRNINIELRKGEIHSIVGENGAGKSTLMKIIFAIEKQTSGKIYYKGEEINYQGSMEAINNGIGMVHQHFMLIPSFTVAQNIVMGAEPTRSVFIDKKEAVRKTQELAHKYNFDIDVTRKVSSLTVSEKQKVEILKTLYRNAEVIILDEPTRGIDVGAKREIYELINDLARAGKAVIVISSDMEEVLGISDRIAVMHEGRIAGMVEKKDFSQQIISEYAIGGAKL